MLTVAHLNMKYNECENNQPRLEDNPINSWIQNNIESQIDVPIVTIMQLCMTKCVSLVSHVRGWKIPHPMAYIVLEMWLFLTQIIPHTMGTISLQP